MTSTRQSVRLQLSENEARALHSALLEAIAADLLPTVHVEAATKVRDRLRDHVPSWLECSAVGGEAGYVIAADAVLNCGSASSRGRCSRSSSAATACSAWTETPAFLQLQPSRERRRRVGARGAARPIPRIP
jgi:hypothetical protein